MLTQANAIADRIVAWRREFHAHPELGFQEQRTAARVAEVLASLGWQVRRGVGRTGVVADLGQGSPRIALRGGYGRTAPAGDQPRTICLAGARGDACLRSRRPHRHLAGCGGDARPCRFSRQHSPALPAIRRGQRRRRGLRRAAHDPGRGAGRCGCRPGAAYGRVYSYGKHPHRFRSGFRRSRFLPRPGDRARRARRPPAPGGRSHLHQRFRHPCPERHRLAPHRSVSIQR